PAPCFTPTARFLTPPEAIDTTGDQSVSALSTEAPVMTKQSLLLAFAGVLTACGPVKSTSNILDAEVQIQAARTAGAEKEAPYEWTAANLYLQKAREEVGYSDYQAGVDFAVKASRFANEAREKAMSAANSGDSQGRPQNP
ncbi:DUF4398 domain-containing protein, partial [Corallococcus exiguus]